MRWFLTLFGLFFVSRKGRQLRAAILGDTDTLRIEKVKERLESLDQNIDQIQKSMSPSYGLISIGVFFLLCFVLIGLGAEILPPLAVLGTLSVIGGILVAPGKARKAQLELQKKELLEVKTVYMQTLERMQKGSSEKLEQCWHRLFLCYQEIRDKQPKEISEANYLLEEKLSDIRSLLGECEKKLQVLFELYCRIRRIVPQEEDSFIERLGDIVERLADPEEEAGEDEDEDILKKARKDPELASMYREYKRELAEVRLHVDLVWRELPVLHHQTSATDWKNLSQEFGSSLKRASQLDSESENRQKTNKIREG